MSTAPSTVAARAANKKKAASKHKDGEDTAAEEQGRGGRRKLDRPAAGSSRSQRRVSGPAGGSRLLEPEIRIQDRRNKRGQDDFLAEDLAAGDGPPPKLRLEDRRAQTAAKPKASVAVALPKLQRPGALGKRKPAPVP
ncbi:MAG: hypothetical protein J2O48_05780, partial [Solirubrobacterales bacterium]|nr:hypothetical protein [Solirubrobacterales bacterium]